jgi:tight adherence protein B
MSFFAVAFALLAGAFAGVAGCALVFEAASRFGSRLGSWVSRVHRVVRESIAPLRRAGVEGIDATRSQRRRLQLVFALAALPLGWAAADPLAAAGLAFLAALLSSRALVWRRERYVRRLAKGAGAAALAVADALSSGHSARGALMIAADALDGPIGVEFRCLCADLSLGAPTDAALERLRARAGCRSVDLVTAAIRLQRRSGGNLAALLRDIAGTIEDQARLEDEARAATSQARFTSTIVLAMPLCLLGLGELADPGVVGRVFDSPLGVSLVGTALLFWLAGALLVRRLGRMAV